MVERGMQMRVRLGEMPRVHIPPDTCVTEGKDTALFEKELAAYMYAKHAVAVSSGTMAIYGMFQALMPNVIHARRTVLTSPLTYAATVNAPALLGWDVRFCDVERKTYGMDVSLAREIECDVLFPVHLLGYPVEIGNYPGTVVTDACEAVGSDLTDNLGLMSALSFYPSHTVPAGELGAVVTSVPGLDRLLRLLKDNGRDRSSANAFDHKVVGLNYKSNDLVASIARRQLGFADFFIQRRRLIARRYNDELKVDGGPYDRRCSYLGWPLLCSSLENKEAMVDWLVKNEIECRRMFPLMTDQPAYRGMWPSESFPVAEEISEKGLYIPCHQYLTDDQVDWVVRKVNKRRDS
jgi:dTDP-4-amino-4,6-dideoxygalactose transaminase